MSEIKSASFQADRWVNTFLPKNARATNPLDYSNIVERLTGLVLFAWLRMKGNTAVPAILGKQGFTQTQVHPGVFVSSPLAVSAFGSKLWADALRLWQAVGSVVIKQGGETPQTKADSAKLIQSILVDPNKPIAGLQPVGVDVSAGATTIALELLYREKMAARKVAARSLNKKLAV